MPRSRRAALLLAAASPARCLLAPRAATRTQTRRNLATTPDEISACGPLQRLRLQRGLGVASEDDWRSWPPQREPSKKIRRRNGLASSRPGTRRKKRRRKTRAWKKSDVPSSATPNLPPLPQENWGGLFSPWNAEDDSLDKIYAVQSDPVARSSRPRQVGFEPEEVPQAVGVAPWNSLVCWPDVNSAVYSLSVSSRDAGRGRCVTAPSPRCYGG